jgi:hypothetical protein
MAAQQCQLHTLLSKRRLQRQVPDVMPGVTSTWVVCKHQGALDVLVARGTSQAALQLLAKQHMLADKVALRLHHLGQIFVCCNHTPALPNTMATMCWQADELKCPLPDCQHPHWLVIAISRAISSAH